MPPKSQPIKAHLGRLFFAVVTWAVFSACAWSAPVQYDIFLDTDNDAATGCTITTAKGDFAGLELVLTTTAELSESGSSVTGVTLQRCEEGALSAATTISSGSWPVGTVTLPLVGSPVNVIETFLPLAELGGLNKTVRAGLLTNYAETGEALLSANLFIRAAPASVAPVPALSPFSLALLAAAVGLGGTWLLRRHRGSVMAIGACVLLSSASLVWAATIMMDGQVGDWTGQQPRLSGDGNSTHLAHLWFDHDAKNAYFRIDSCGAFQPDRGELRQVTERGMIEYVSRSGLWSIKVDKHTITVTRLARCLSATVQVWGDPHENLNGKHIKDWLTSRRTLLLDDGTKITMHADSPDRVVHTMNMYDGDANIEIDNNNVINLFEADSDQTQQRDEAEADGETAYIRFVPGTAPGAFGHVEYTNIYTQEDPGVPPQCIAHPSDAGCVEVPLGTTGDLILNPKQVNDWFDDERLAHT